MRPVRLAIVTTPPSAGRADRARLDATGGGLAVPEVTSLTFGDAVVHVGAQVPWRQFRDRATRAGVAVREHPGELDGDRLHVVVQKGRLFQREHPEVPVLLDKGRFLLVELDRASAAKLSESDVPCFAVTPVDALVQNRVDRSAAVFTAATPGAAAADPTLQGLVDRISRPSYEAALARLVGFRTRYSTSSQYVAACDFVDQELAAMGYVTSRQTIAVNGAASQNVIGFRRGRGSAPRGEVLVCAHLDSVNLEGSATSPAPGADDDGSGSAGVIEIARALKNHRGKHDLRLVLFGGEEQGLFGSKGYVARLTAARRTCIRAVVQMDMIGSLNSQVPTVLIEGAPISQAVIAGLASAAATYTHLAVQTSLHPANSDHVPFIRKNVPAVLTIEGTDGANTAIHSPRDTLDRIDFDLALEILRMNTAFVAATLA